MKTQRKETQITEMLSLPTRAIPKELEAFRQMVNRLDVRKVKQYAAIGAGVACGLKLIGSVTRSVSYQSAVAREIKKQMAPVREQLELITRQNQELKAQNELLQARLAAMTPEPSDTDEPM